MPRRVGARKVRKVGLLPLGIFNEDAFVILLFVLVALGVFTDGGSFGENPLVWGFAMFAGLIFASVSALLGAGLGVLLPVLFIGVLLYLNVLGKLVGDGVMAWIVCAFAIMMLAGAGYA